MNPERRTAGTTNDATANDLAAVEARINAILPPRYVGCYEDVSPSSMGSASLKYDKEGRIAWGEIWTTFCHLALAGGPPHRGRWLDGATTEHALSHSAEQQAVVAEIKRAIRLSAQLHTTEDAPPGWIGIRCEDQDMAAWLVRAIVAENVAAHHAGDILYVPAGPEFRLEKEIKNVVVCVAKSCHYLLDHVEPEQRPRGLLVELLQSPSPDDLVAHAAEYAAAAERLARELHVQTGLTVNSSSSPGWLGLECASEEMAVWLQRAIIAEDVLARREGTTLCVPVCLENAPDPASEKLLRVVAHAHRLWWFKAGAAATSTSSD